MQHPKLERLHNAILSGGELHKQQEELHNAYKDMTPEDMTQLLLKKDEHIKQKDLIIEALNSEIDNRDDGIETKTKRMRNTKNIELYDIVNFHNFMKTSDYNALINPKDANYIDPAFYAYDPFESTFDKKKQLEKTYFEYQKTFIENWSVSTSELTILYYGIGTGKTLIAVSCADEYTRLNNNAYVYLLTPASLVLNTIFECYKAGLDPMRKDSNGQYIFNFISYQQLLNSNFDFKDNSLLIIDEAHNLRNFKSEEISEKKSGRTYEKTGNYSLVGNKLSERLLNSSTKFLRSIFMSGSLLVNDRGDIEALMSIGYKKQPLLDIDRLQYDMIISSDKEFDIYYGGLISYKSLSEKDITFKNYPKKHYKFVNLPSDDVYLYSGKEMKSDSYFRKSRNQGISNKMGWIYAFLQEHKNEKTLIYSQFLGAKVKVLYSTLEKIVGFKVAIISGENTQKEKLDIVKKYNSGEINIIIFSLAIKEGISFFETKNFICIEPYWNYAIFEQVLGRGVRASSHKKGNKSTVNFYFLVATTKNSITNKWFDVANKTMNDNIKKLIFVKDDKNIKNKLEFNNNHGSRDIDLYNRMFIKQESINEFEKRLLNPLISFEKWQSIENNEFIEIIKTLELEYQQKYGKLPTNKELIEIRKEVYKDLYNKKIKETEGKIIRFENDVRFRENRKPDLEQKMINKDYGNQTELINGLLKEKASLGNIFKKLGIDSKEITQFQANFTPVSEVQQLLKNSGIFNDDREKILILEPTAGIGNVITELLNPTPNNDGIIMHTKQNQSNFFIDCNEYHNAFYQIGKGLFNDIDNIKWYNADFWIYQSKYTYHYILGNPPFNLQTQVMIKTMFIKEKGKPTPDPAFKIEKVDKTLYDVHFVSKAYNMLVNGGVLSMIISDRFTKSDLPVFRVFKEYMNFLTNEGIAEGNKEKYFKKYDVKSFKSDKGVVKEQETSFPMVNIVLRKLENFNINLDDPKIVNKRILQYMDDKNNKALLSQEIKAEDKKFKKDNKIVRTLVDGTKPKRTRKTTEENNNLVVEIPETKAIKTTSKTSKLNEILNVNTPKIEEIRRKIDEINKKIEKETKYLKKKEEIPQDINTIKERYIHYVNENERLYNKYHKVNDKKLPIDMATKGSREKFNIKKNAELNEIYNERLDNHKKLTPYFNELFPDKEWELNKIFDFPNLPGFKIEPPIKPRRKDPSIKNDTLEEARERDEKNKAIAEVMDVVHYDDNFEEDDAEFQKSERERRAREAKYDLENASKRKKKITRRI